MTKHTFYNCPLWIGRLTDMIFSCNAFANTFVTGAILTNGLLINNLQLELLHCHNIIFRKSQPNTDNGAF